MRTFLLILLLFLCIIGFVITSSKFRLKKYGMLGIATICIGIFLLGSEIINTSILPEETRKRVEQVTEICGDTYIQVNGNNVEVLINDQWVNLEDISLIGGLLTDEIILEYDGKEIYLGETGIINTIKALEAVGLIKSK